MRTLHSAKTSFVVSSVCFWRVEFFVANNYNSANEKAVLFVVLGNKNNNSCWGLKSGPEIKKQPGKVALVFLVKNRAACFFLPFLRLYRSVFFL